MWQTLVRTLAEFEPVHVLAGGEAVMAQARAMVGDVPNVTLHDIPTNDAWARDHGPMFLAGPQRVWSRRWSIGSTTPGAASIRRSIWTTPCREHVAATDRPAAFRAGHHPGRGRGRRQRRRARS